MPIGLYIEFQRSEFAGNGEDGIHCTAGTTGSLLPTGVVGGARVKQGSGYDYRSSGSAGFLPSGQGVMNRCTVHNNQGKGITFDIHGAGVGFLRTTNTIFWNNTEEGYFASVGNAVPGNSYPKLACPLIYCTLAGNGDAVGANIEVLVPDPTFEFLLDPRPGADTLATKFYSSIFERKIHDHLQYPDWGQSIRSLLIAEENPILANSQQIGCLGLLESEDVEQLILQNNWGQGNAYWSIAPAPFAGRPFAGGNGIVWTSDDPSQFMVSSTAGANAFYNQTPAHLGGMSVVDLGTDFEGLPRTNVPNGSQGDLLIVAWKGADEQ